MDDFHGMEWVPGDELLVEQKSFEFFNKMCCFFVLKPWTNVMMFPTDTDFSED